MNNKIGKTILLVILIVLFSAGGFGAGYLYEKSAAQKQMGQVAQEIFKNVLSTSFLSGKVLAVANDSLTVDVSQINGLSVPEQYRQKNVLVNDQTKIFSFEQKSQQEIQAAMAQAKNVAGSATSSVPMLWTQKTLKLSDIKVGDQVSFSFTPKAGLTILDKEFTATQVQRMQIAAALIPVNNK